MARKTTTCFRCKQKTTILKKITIDDEKDYWFCEHCFKEMTEKELNNLTNKYYIMKTLNLKKMSKVLNERTDAFIENTDTKYLLPILKNENEKIKKYLETKTFKNDYQKLAYLQRVLESKIKQYQELEKNQINLETVEIPIPVVERVFKKVRNISKWL